MLLRHRNAHARGQHWGAVHGEHGCSYNPLLRMNLWDAIGDLALPCRGFAGAAASDERAAAADAVETSHRCSAETRSKGVKMLVVKRLPVEVQRRLLLLLRDHSRRQLVNPGGLGAVVARGKGGLLPSGAHLRHCLVGSRLSSSGSRLSGSDRRLVGYGWGLEAAAAITRAVVQGRDEWWLEPIEQLIDAAGCRHACGPRTGAGMGKLRLRVQGRGRRKDIPEADLCPVPTLFHALQVGALCILRDGLHKGLGHTIQRQAAHRHRSQSHLCCMRASQGRWRVSATSACM